MGVEVTRHTVDGTEYPIKVDSHGRFLTIVDGSEVSADTLDGLKQKLTRMMRKASVRISLPAIYEIRSSSYSTNATGQLEDVTITGLHQRNKSILLRRANGKADTADGHYSTGLFKPEMDKAKYKALLKAKTDADAAFEKYVEQYKFSRHTIETHVNKAEKEAGIE